MKRDLVLRQLYSELKIATHPPIMDWVRVLGRLEGVPAPRKKSPSL